MDFWKYLVGICSGHKMEVAGHKKSMEAKEEARARSMLQSSYEVTRHRKVCCLGLELGEAKTGFIVVTKVFSNNFELQQDNKVEVGDRLLAVDSNIVKGYDLDVVCSLLDGSPETAVNLHLARPLLHVDADRCDFVFVTLIRDNSIIESKFSSHELYSKEFPTLPIYADIISYGSQKYQSKNSDISPRFSKAHQQDMFLNEDRLSQLKVLEAGEAARRKYQLEMAQSHHRKAVSVQDVRNKQFRSRFTSSADEKRSSVRSQHPTSFGEATLNPGSLPIWFSARKSRPDDKRLSTDSSINRHLNFEGSSTTSSEGSYHEHSMTSMASPI
eukprot:751498-Hanusia_phi.AAC.3